jgi:prevent-host-death family protein
MGKDEFELVHFAEHAGSILGIAAGRAKNLFGTLLDRAAARPVVITKNDRPAVVVVEADRYLTLLRDQEELLTRKAVEIAEGQGFIGEEATADLNAEIRRRAAVG